MVGVPETRASAARESTGSASLAKLFHSPDTSSPTDVREREKPHDEFIAYVSPSEMAAPPTIVLETAVVVMVETVASRSRIPGIEVTMTNW